MRTLVIGYGSIGSRHARLLVELGCIVSVASSREIDFSPRYTNIFDAIDKGKPDYIVIANNTSEHYATLARVADFGYNGRILVEKPLFDQCCDLPKNSFNKIFVGYNLRFHPAIQELKKLLCNEKIISVQVYVGQYLPEWRTSIDYRSTYSARASKGGGVLRDLSHEIDYINLIFGGWECLTATGGHFSNLQIDSDDVFSIMMVTSKCPVVVLQLNYIDRAIRREIIVNTNNHTIKVDLVKGLFELDGVVKNYMVSRDTTYRLQHQAVLEDDCRWLCSVDEGIEVMKIIKAAENAAKLRMWIKNE